jgi:hypothetical protein
MGSLMGNPNGGCAGMNSTAVDCPRDRNPFLGREREAGRGEPQDLRHQQRGEADGSATLAYESVCAHISQSL